MKKTFAILFLVISMVVTAFTVCAGDLTQQDVIMARRDAERAARQAVNEAQNRLNLIPRGKCSTISINELNNDTFASFMTEQNALLREQNNLLREQVSILTRLANVIAPTNMVLKLEKE